MFGVYSLIFKIPENSLFLIKILVGLEIGHRARELRLELAHGACAALQARPVDLEAGIPCFGSIAKVTWLWLMSGGNTVIPRRRHSATAVAVATGGVAVGVAEARAGAGVDEAGGVGFPGLLQLVPASAAMIARRAAARSNRFTRTAPAAPPRLAKPASPSTSSRSPLKGGVRVISQIRAAWNNGM